MALQRFTRPQIELMVEHMTSGKSVPATVRQHLVEKSDGIPLYVEEMTKTILESGVLTEADTLAKLTASLTSFTFLAQGRCLLGWALAAQGQGEEGVKLMRQGVMDMRATGTYAAPPSFLPALAEAYSMLGQVDEALLAVAEALELFEQTGMRWREAETYRIKGTLLLHQTVSDACQAESCFQQALDIARQQQAKFWELRAATSLARLWQSQDKRQDAYELLAPVCKWFTEGFDTADLIDARSLLDELRV
jgi:predicted ATPase